MIGATEKWDPAVGDPIIGWRTWRAEHQEDDTWLLRSLYHDVYWPPGEPLAAECRIPAGQKIPEHGCPAPPDTKGVATPAWPNAYHPRAIVHECGIYATKSRESAELYRGGSIGEAMVLGAVKLWGKVAVHAKGYRAQFAYPEFLVVLRAPNGVDAADVAWALTGLYRVETGAEQ